MVVVVVYGVEDNGGSGRRQGDIRREHQASARKDYPGGR